MTLRRKRKRRLPSRSNYGSSKGIRYQIGPSFRYGTLFTDLNGLMVPNSLQRSLMLTRNGSKANGTEQ